MPAEPGPIPSQLDELVVLFAYEGVGRAMVAGGKYRGAHAALGALGVAAATLVEPERSRRLSVVTWAPTSAPRKRARGVDQAEVVATAVARTLRVPVRGLLRRGPGPAQTGRPRAQRLSGPAFVSVGTVETSGGVLLVDDVVTTGATMSAAAAALREAGAATVFGLALARTPQRRAVATRR